MSAFFSKKSVFLSKKSTFTQSNSVRAVLEIFWFCFLRQKATITENRTFADSLSGIQSPDCSKLAKNTKNENDVIIYWYDVIVKNLWRGFVSFVKFSYWSKFHVNIITGSGIMTTFFYKRLTRNPEIGNTPVWVLPGIWRLGKIIDIKFGMNVSLQNSRVTVFTVFELLRENQLEGKITAAPPPPPSLPSTHAD